MKKILNDWKGYGKCDDCGEYKILIKSMSRPIGEYEMAWKYLKLDNVVVGYLCKECSVVESI